MLEDENASYQVSLSSDAFSASSKTSHREPLLHYNEMKDGDTVDELKNSKKKVRGGCVTYLKRFDELILRPIFIYKYEKEMHKRAHEFFDIFMHDGAKLEKIFAE